MSSYIHHEKKDMQLKVSCLGLEKMTQRLRALDFLPEDSVQCSASRSHGSQPPVTPASRFSHLYPGAQVHLHIIKNSKSFVLLVLKEAGQGKTLSLSLAKVSFTLMTLLAVLVGMGVRGVHLACVLLRIEPRALCMPAEVLLTDQHPGLVIFYF